MARRGRRRSEGEADVFIAICYKKHACTDDRCIDKYIYIYIYIDLYIRMVVIYTLIYTYIYTLIYTYPAIAILVIRG